MDADTDYENYRPLVFSLAYRMLGSATDAEDIVQETFIRFHGVPREEVVSAPALLTTIATRLCLNEWKSARAAREQYVGTWLPEPVLTDDLRPHEPTQRMELHESLSMAFLTLLESLTPAERAVFLLRQVFDYGYDEIAAIVGKSETACRQLFSRAHKNLADRRPRFTPDPEEHRRVLDQFLRSVETGDLESLKAMLADDVVLWADGAGRVRGAIRRPLQGRDIVADFLRATRSFRPTDYTIELVTVNGERACVLTASGEAFAVLFATVADGRVQEIRVVGNPEKLSWVNHTRRSPF